MGRYTGPTDRISRREGVNLFLKGERSYNGKTAIEKRPDSIGFRANLRGADAHEKGAHDGGEAGPKHVRRRRLPQNVAQGGSGGESAKLREAQLALLLVEHRVVGGVAAKSQQLGDQMRVFGDALKGLDHVFRMRHRRMAKQLVHHCLQVVCSQILDGVPKNS